MAEPQVIAGDADRAIDLRASVDRPVPADVVAWLRAAASPLAGAEPGHGTDDLQPLSAAIGDAHLIALGEASRGTREFFQLKQRHPLSALRPRARRGRRARAGRRRPRR